MSWGDGGTEAEALNDQWDGEGFEDDECGSSGPSTRVRELMAYRNPRKGTKTVDNTDRYRCLVKGCNPVLRGADAATAHSKTMGHRTAQWPVRSAAGKAKAQQRNRSGYYDKYNVGMKRAAIRERYIK